MVYGYSFAGELELIGDYVLLAEGQAGLAIINISNPAAMPLTEYHIADVYGVTVVDNLAYLSCQGDGLQIIDISVPTSPTQVGSYGPYYSSNGPENTVVVGDRAYIAQGIMEFIVLDVSNPAEPLRVWQYYTPGNPRDVSVVGNLAFIADGTGGIQIISPNSQVEVVQVAKYDTNGLLCGTSIAGSHAFTLSENDGMGVAEIQNPRRTKEIAKPYTSGSVQQMRLRDDLGFLVASVAVRTYNIADPSHPLQQSSFVSRRRVPDPWNEDSVWAYSWPVDAAPINNYLLVAYYGDSLTTRDMSDPVHPAVAGTCRTNIPMREIAVDGEYAYVAAESSGVVVFDISNPTQVDSLSALAGLGNVMAVDARGSLVAAATWDAGVRIIDATNTTDLKEISWYPTIGRVRDVAIVNNFLYVVDDGYGLRVLDVAQPTNPIAIGYQTSRAPRGITSYGDRLFYSDAELGTLILRNMVQPTSVALPRPGWELSQNYPNPFNPHTTIALTVPSPTRAQLVIYDVAGRRVRTLLNGEVQRGVLHVEWDGRTDTGQAAASGVYFYQLRVEGVKMARKMVLLR